MTDARPTSGAALAKVRPVTKTMVAEAIDAAEQEFEWCLKVLAPLGGYAANADFAEAVPKFQLQLLDAITALEQVYRRVKQEEKRLISRKPDLNQGWFRQRMVKLAFYTKALVHVLAIGRSIGRRWRLQRSASSRAVARMTSMSRPRSPSYP